MVFMTVYQIIDQDDKYITQVNFKLNMDLKTYEFF